MNERELYRQKKQAQLDEWKAEVDKLQAKVAGASADARLESNKRIEALERKIDKGDSKLAEIANASEDAWESIKEGVESAWGSIKAAVGDAADPFRK